MFDNSDSLISKGLDFFIHPVCIMIVMVFPSIEKKFTLKIINHKIALIVLLTVQL